MSKRSQIDRAIDSLEDKIADIRAKANAEVTAMEHAVLTLKAQKVKKASRPRAVPPVEKVGA